MANRRGHCPTLLSLQGPFSLLMAWECGSQCLVFWVTGFGGHWHDSSGHELKLWIKSHKLGAKALARNKETTGFVLTASFPQWLGFNLYATNGLPSKHGDTGDLEKGSHLPSRTTRFWQFNGCSWTITVPTAKPDFQDSSSPPRDARNVTGCMGMLCGLVGSLTKITIYLTYTICCKRLWSMPAPIPGSSSIRWWTTWLTYKQLKLY